MVSGTWGCLRCVPTQLGEDGGEVRKEALTFAYVTCRPKKIPLGGGLKITRAEYNALLEAGLDVQAGKAKAAAAE
jgi:hypothetical protein